MEELKDPFVSVKVHETARAIAKQVSAMGTRQQVWVSRAIVCLAAEEFHEAYRFAVGNLGEQEQHEIELLRAGDLNVWD